MIGIIIETTIFVHETNSQFIMLPFPQQSAVNIKFEHVNVVRYHVLILMLKHGK